MTTLGDAACEFGEVICTIAADVLEGMGEA